jgi:hypothetical protein
MIDPSLETRVTLDMIWKYIDDLWTVYFHSMCDALFCMADFGFLWFKSIYCFILNCWELSSMVSKPQ